MLAKHDENYMPPEVGRGALKAKGVKLGEGATHPRCRSRGRQAGQRAQIASLRNSGRSSPLIARAWHFALILALVVAVVQTTVPAWGVRVGDSRLMAIGAIGGAGATRLTDVSFLG